MDNKKEQQDIEELANKHKQILKLIRDYNKLAIETNSEKRIGLVNGSEDLEEYLTMGEVPQHTDGWFPSNICW